MKKLILILFLFLSMFAFSQTTTKVIRFATDSTIYSNGIAPGVLIGDISTGKVYISLISLAPNLSIKTSGAGIRIISITPAQAQAIIDNTTNITILNDTTIILRTYINNNYDSITDLRSDLDSVMANDTIYATKVALADSTAALRAGLATKLNISDTASMLAYYRNKLALKLNISDTAAMLLYYKNALDRKLNISDTLAMLAWYRTQLGLKLNVSDTGTMLLPYHGKLAISDTTAMLLPYHGKLNIADTALMLSYYLKKTDTTAMLIPYHNKLSIGDTALMLSPYLRSNDTIFIHNELNTKLNISDTAAMLLYYKNKLVGVLYSSDTSAMLLPYLKIADTTTMLAAYAAKSWVNDSLSNHLTLIKANRDSLVRHRIELNTIESLPSYGITSTQIANWDTAYANRIATFTTTGSSGAATFTGNTLNIPNYTLAGLGYATPTLDQVTTAGATTTNAVSVGSITPSNLSTGYIPYKSVTSLGNSPIYTDGTNVGIGTTVSSDLLSVAQITNDQVTSTSSISLSTGLKYGSTANPKNLDLNFRGGASDHILAKIRTVDELFNINGGYLSFWTNPTETALAERMRIDRNGNVGIGYSTGTEITNNKLAVNGNGYFAGNVTATGNITSQGNITLSDIAIPATPTAGLGTIYSYSQKLYYKNNAGTIYDLTSAGLSDAPTDGSTYGRNNGAWTIVSGGSGTTDYINSATFNTTSGLLAGTGVGSASFSINLDGRYYLASNPSGYISSYTETDPVYTASSWHTTTNNSTNWNNAYDSIAPQRTDINSNYVQINKNIDTLGIHRTAINLNTAKVSFPGFGITTGKVWGYDAHPTTTSGYGLPAYPTTLPASDVYAWAKAATKPSYTTSEISEGTNLYYTDARVAANSAVAANTAKVSFPGLGTTSTTAYRGDYGNAAYNGRISSFTTTGSSGAATFTGNVLNIPNYTLSGLGGQPLLTNPVTGTGTSGYIPKFTGTSSVGNSPIYTDGTNVGIGTTALSQALDVAGNINTSGQYMINGTQVAYLPDQTNFTGTLIIGNGGGSLTHTSGADGRYNTFVGIGAGSSNTTGYQNTANGMYSLNSNTTGYNNTANGYASLNFNTTGYQNTANGYASLYYNTTGYNNTANGMYSLNSNTTGYNNTANGLNAGYFIADGTTGRITGNNGLYLGYNSKASADGTDNEIVIGANAIGNGSNSVTLGNTSVTKTLLNGNVGIGTVTPGTYKLNVNGNGYFNGTLTATGAFSASNFSGSSSGTNTGDQTLAGLGYSIPTLQQVTTAGATTTNAVLITNTTASTSATTGALIVTGGLGVSGISYFGNNLNSGGAIYATNGISTGGTMAASDFILSSDSTLKHDIKPLTVNVSSVPLVQFKFKADTTNRERFGVIAQDLQKIAPAMVYRGQDGKLKVSYISFLVARLANDENRIDSLKMVVSNQQKQINDVLKRVKILENAK